MMLLAALFIGPFLVLVLVQLAVLVLGAFLVEKSAALFMEKVRHRGRLYRVDAVLGWANLPGLAKDLVDSDGALYHVESNHLGYRGNVALNEQATKRVLVLGDCFAFGEGINISDRFDSLIGSGHPEWSIVNLGVIRYGPDQELLSARGYLDRLGPGDAVVLLTDAYKDFARLLRSSIDRRPKPWFELVDGRLVQHAPQITLLSHFRDRSYLLSRMSSYVEYHPPSAYSIEQYRQAGQLYQTLVETYLREAAARDVNVIIAYHGVNWLKGGAGEVALEVFRAERLRNIFQCVALDDALCAAGGDLYQKDLHWTAAGNAVVARALDDCLARRSGPGKRTRRVDAVPPSEKVLA